MSEENIASVCPVCGLPRELCMCAAIATEKQKIVVRAAKRKFGKITTIIEGMSGKDIDLKKIAKQLKEKLACGGTIKDNTIELLGDHRQRVKAALQELSFPADSIEIIAKVD